MGVTLTTLLRGPAAATFNGHTFFAQDGILVTPALELEAVESDANGVLDATVIQTPVTIRFTPSAPIGDLLALYPSLQGAPGELLFGAADMPLVLTAANGVRLTFAAVAITQMPDLLLTTRGAIAGTVTFLAVGARALGIDAANRVVTIDTATMPVAPSGTPQLADDFTVTWGAAPWVSLRSKDGVRVRFALTTKPVLSDANALLDLTVEKLAVEVRFTPETPGGPAEADVFAGLLWQGAGSAPGRLASAAAETLDVAGDGIFVRLPEAELTAAELAFDAKRPRVGELVFTAGRAFVGTAEAMAVVSAGRPA
jgi:hypothetical protein